MCIVFLIALFSLTYHHTAPEVLLNKGHGKGVDWWTLGILMYEMMVGEPPFLDEDPMRIYQQILTGKISFTRSYDKYAKSLTKKLLTADLTKRYGCLNVFSCTSRQEQQLGRGPVELHCLVLIEESGSLFIPHGKEPIRVWCRTAFEDRFWELLENSFHIR